jgi:ABC-2 type transport system permease protein
MLIFIPALAMRSFAEEKRNNTIETLLSFPITETEIVLAKSGALFTLVGMALSLTLLIPVTLIYYSHLYIPEILSGYVGLLLYGLSVIGISVFFSSITKNQVIAFLYSVICVFLMLVIATEFTANVLPKLVQDAVTYFGFLYHLSNFIKGVIDIRSVFYFISLFAVSTFLTVINLERRG